MKRIANRVSTISLKCTYLPCIAIRHCAITRSIIDITRARLQELSLASPGKDYRLCVYANGTVCVDSKVTVGSSSGSDCSTWTSVYDSGTASDDTPLGIQRVLDTLTMEQRQKQKSHAAETRAAASSSAHRHMMDFSVYTPLQGAKEYIKRNYPRLHLVVDHASTQDLQGNKTHTASVYMRAGIVGAELSESEREVLQKFRGDSVGLGYNGTVRRAMIEAFQSASLQLPETSGSENASASHISLFLDVLRSNCESLVIDIQRDAASSSVAIAVRDGDKELSSLSGKQQHTLSLLLSAIELAALKVNPSEAQRARERATDSPLIIILPDANVRVKRVFRKLVAYYYGVTEDGVDFRVSHPVPGVVHCDVVISLHHPTDDGVRVECTLGSSSATTKKLATQMAAVSIMKEHFSRIYEEQIAFHPEVHALVGGIDATRQGAAKPLLSRGLRSQLDWAVASHNWTVHVESERLLPRTNYPHLGCCARQLTWVATLTLSGEGITEARVVRAFDSKKSRAELKGIAAALAQHFASQCAEAVQQATAQGLITSNGEAAACPNIGPLENKEADSGPNESSFYLFPIENVLTPHPIPISIPPVEKSILTLYKDLWMRYVREQQRHLTESRHLKDIESTTQQRLNNDSNHTSYTTALALPGNAQETSRVSVHTSTVEIISIFGAYHALFRDAPPPSGKGSTASLKAVDGIRCIVTAKDREELSALLVMLASCHSPVKPLESVVNAFMILYGLNAELRSRVGPKGYEVELWGCASGMENDAKPYYLGRGIGKTQQEAFVRCGRYCYAAHIEPCLSVFPGRVIVSGKCDLVINSPDCELQKLMGAVVMEINAMNASEMHCTPTMQVSFSVEQDHKYECTFNGKCADRSVVLEKTSETTLPGALRAMCEHVSAEMNIDFAMPRLASFDKPATHVLEHVCAKVFGLCINTETRLLDGLWHARVSLALGADRYYTFAVSTDMRKKDAIERAAKRALEMLYTEKDATGNGQCDSQGSQGNVVFTLL